jgi:ABC-type dipeptide/oligopeptide/nickel transport system permease subunit
MIKNHRKHNFHTPKNYILTIGLALLAILTNTAIFAPYIAPYNPELVLIGIEKINKREPPCIYILGCSKDYPQHFFGTDGNSRDLFSRVVYGMRLSLIIGVLTVAIASAIGLIVGAIAGYIGGWIDNVIMLLMDILLSFPTLLLSIVIISVIGSSLINAILTICVISIPTYARIVRVSILSIKNLDYIAAAIALGASPIHIFLKHMLLNVLPALMIQMVFGIANAILDVSALSFLGLGVQPPTPELGSMLGIESRQILNAPHVVIFPGLAILLIVLVLNIVGEGLRQKISIRAGFQERK